MLSLSQKHLQVEKRNRKCNPKNKKRQLEPPNCGCRNHLVPHTIHYSCFARCLELLLTMWSGASTTRYIHIKHDTHKAFYTYAAYAACIRGVPRSLDRCSQYGIKVSFWGSGSLKIVVYVENYSQKRCFRLDDYHPLWGGGC